MSLYIYRCAGGGLYRLKTEYPAAFGNDVIVSACYRRCVMQMMDVFVWVFVQYICIFVHVFAPQLDLKYVCDGN